MPSRRSGPDVESSGLNFLFSHSHYLLDAIHLMSAVLGCHLSGSIVLFDTMCVYATMSH